MATESVILTALPNGTHSSGMLKVTIFVSPRLSTDRPDAKSITLSNFPSFSNWPEALERLRHESKIEILFEGLDALPSQPDPDSEAADAAVWKTVFDADKVGVLTAGFKDLSDRRVLTYPSSDLSEAILTLYTNVAGDSPTSFPSVTKGPLANFSDLLGTIADNPEEFNKMLDNMFDRTAGDGKRGRFFDRSPGGMAAAATLQMGFVQAQRFYDRPNTRDPKGKNAVPEPPEKPVIDFHGYCASMGDYPRLLRQLGLAIDVLVEPPHGFKPNGRIRVQIPTPPADLSFVAAEEARPWTNFETRDRRFIPRPRDENGDLEDGTLRLEAKKEPRLFDVHQIDVDGSVLKTLYFAANMKRLKSHLLTTGERSMTKDEASLPALRTGGFLVTRNDRARVQVGQIDSNAASEDKHSTGQPADLWAEDVIRGYRPDVFDYQSNQWHTLSAREGRYAVVDNGQSTEIPVKPDEGFVKGSSATSVPTEAEADLYLHEALFGWEGWSLAAKRPGQAIVDNAGEKVGTVDPEPPDDFPLVTEFQPTPGSLPRLRFGRKYTFRARAADLAGNSVEGHDIEDAHRSEPVKFQRYDPIPSPAFVPRRPYSEGESLVRMVIRSTLGVVPADYVQLARITGLAGHTEPMLTYIEVNDRHLAAPKTSVQLAEWHAMFDKAIGQNAAQGDVDEQFDIASLESGSFMQAGPGVSVYNPNPAATPTDLSTLEKGGTLQSGEIVLHDVPHLTLPYLPDPMSSGISFTQLPGDPATRLTPWVSGGWPDARPLRLRIEHGGLTTDSQEPPRWSAGGDVLTVFLRQADMFTLRVSSVPADLGPHARLDMMGIWNLLTPAKQGTLQTTARQGRHWMLSPYAELTLVHAVEKPLTAPIVSVDNAGVQRLRGETFAVLGGRLDNHAKSTGRLDLDATWDEQVDDLAKDLPNDGETGNLPRIDGAAHVVDFQLEATEDGCRVGRNDVPRTATSAPVHKVRHEFGDTKHRTVDYVTTATTRFREYFPPAITDDPALITHKGPVRKLSIPSSRRPDPPEILYVVPTFKWTDDSFFGIPAGLPSNLLPQQVLTALTSGRRSRGIFDTGFRLDSPDFSVASKPSAAVRPGAANLGVTKPPAVVKLPRVTRQIRTAGLRVYLKRPWYSSGDGELLAVVVPDQPYFLWPFDAKRGFEVSSAVRAMADEAARKIIASGRIKGAGGVRLSPTEQVLAGLQKMSDPAAGDKAEAAQELMLTGFQGGLFAEIIGTLDFLKTGDPEKFITRYGSDPIWGSDAPATGPWIHQFPLRTAVGTGLALAEAPGHKVTAIGHTPKFDATRGLWYCDIDIDAGTSYFPFVKLGLARYQPWSIDGVHLSRVVAPEWAQLLTKRTASVTRPTGTEAMVSVVGPAGFTDLAENVLGGAAAAGQAGMELSRFVVAQVERLPAGARTDLAWVPAGSEVRLAMSLKTPYSNVMFTSRVPVPKAAPGEKLRITVREYEILQTDDTEADDVVAHSTFSVGNVPPANVGAPELIVHPDDRPVRFRLVYADHLPV